MQRSDDCISASLGENNDYPLDRDWLSEYLSCRRQETGDADSKTRFNNDEFTVVTWNIWFSQHEWQARLKAALAETLDHDPDVFCFQEVRTQVHHVMLNCSFLRDRYDPTEERLPYEYDDCSIWIKRQSRIQSVCCKTVPSLQTIYGRLGVSVDLELAMTKENDQVKIRVFTCHLASGKEMGATRRGQLQSLFDFLRHSTWKASTSSSLNDKASSMDVAFLVGDFNLDSSHPENELVETNGVDIWNVLHPNDAGVTRNTSLTNVVHKQARRIDRVIMVQPPNQVDRVILPQSIQLLGTTPIDDEGELWVSDHFGLVATVKVESASNRNKKINDGDGRKQPTMPLALV